MKGGTLSAAKLPMAIEGVSGYMALQMELARGKEGNLERASSLYGLGYLLGIVDAACQHYLIDQESEAGVAIAAQVFRGVFPNDVQAERQFAASVASQGLQEHEDGMMAGGEEMYRFLSGETVGVLRFAAFLATGRKRMAP